jgi:hypothetical protein
VTHRPSAQAGVRPSAGVRFVLERGDQPRDGAWRYAGFAHVPGGDLPAEVAVSVPSGATTARVEGRADLEPAAAALVRAATKSAVAAGGTPPRKVVRWRG